jgi:hypothetical protein
VARKSGWEFPSLEWIHRIREEHYKKTRRLALEAWLKPVDPEKAAEACREMGLKVRVAKIKRRKAG